VKTHFDYIIVGAGSSGAALATRLTESPEVSVLLLEAGGADRHPFIHMPIAHGKIRHWPSISWNFKSELEPALGSRNLVIPRGKTLGGSSSINGMMYVRGNARDYDLWRQRGLKGWGYADVLPYFKRLETSWRGADRYHGDRGPLPVTQVDSPSILYETLERAAIAAGHKSIDDPYAEAQEGISRLEVTIKDGVRQSTAKTYLALSQARSNLTIVTGASTSRILLDRLRAVGVEYHDGATTKTARANREVIVSSGSYGTPKLLMLSGMGPADHLKEMKIQVAHDLPGVGQNLSEHPIVHTTFKALGTDTFTKQFRWDRATLNVLQWYFLRSGPFAQNGAYANIFLRTDTRLDRPDIQIVCAAIGFDAELWFPGATAPPVHRYTVSPCVLHPQSRGWVKLRSADPKDSPRILFNMFRERVDIDTLIEGFKASRDIYSREPQKSFVSGSHWPDERVKTDAEIEGFLRKATAPMHHPVGTCTMGVGQDAVVDENLCVQGIEALRVVDASVMPELPSGNTNIPAIMIAEKAADLILGRSLSPADV
jgi:choline dehydrogenase